MDWTLAIEKNRDFLRRVLAMLVAMVATANGGSAGGQSSEGGQFYPDSLGSRIGRLTDQS